LWAATGIDLSLAVNRPVGCKKTGDIKGKAGVYPAIIGQDVSDRGFAAERTMKIIYLIYNKYYMNENANHNERANKDMLYGALWCIGGIIATISDLGYIFWGAIVFGAIQFFRGLLNRS
jgi:hypothetical protein